MDFTVLQGFYSDEVESFYVKGLSYSARPQDRTLLELLPKWIDEGKVEAGRPAAAIIKGE